MSAPWSSPGSWLRCALHAHTTNSDGELAPRALVKHYVKEPGTVGVAVLPVEELPDVVKLDDTEVGEEAVAGDGVETV